MRKNKKRLNRSCQEQYKSALTVQRHRDSCRNGTSDRSHKEEITAPIPDQSVRDGYF